MHTNTLNKQNYSFNKVNIDKDIFADKKYIYEIQLLKNIFYDKVYMNEILSNQHIS